MGFAAGVFLAAADGGGMGILGFLVRVIIAVVVFFFLFWFRMMGAGDIKALALVYGALGVKQGIFSISWSLFFGAVFGLARLWRHGLLRQRLTYLFVYIRQYILTKNRAVYYEPARDGYEGTLHFAVCIFIGTAVQVYGVQKGWW